MPKEKSNIVVCLSLVSHYVKILTIFLLVLKYCNFTNCLVITSCIHVIILYSIWFLHAWNLWSWERNIQLWLSQLNIVVVDYICSISWRSCLIHIAPSIVLVLVVYFICILDMATIGSHLLVQLIVGIYSSSSR
jgi:hypothetical protein